MARPRRDSGETPAIDRLETAFWEMLAETPYKDLTITSLSRRAKVNHNTFYYYFGSLDDMATEMIERNLVAELPAQILANSQVTTEATQFIADPDLQLRFQRVCLLVGPHSATWIVDKLEQAVIGLWLQAFGIDRSDLSKDDELKIVFIFGGLLRVLGQYGTSDPTPFQGLTSSGLGAAALATLHEIVTKRGFTDG